MDFLNWYLGLLKACFEYDITVYSQPWIYWALLVPVTFYTAFFMVKWAILTLPFWLPIRLMFPSEGIKISFNTYKYVRKHKPSTH
ncbi:hypothetical protein GCM10028806_33340 [Spirosoma terrae]|uniref:Uncharacterized protein n=1 Tax=Spirosoma terrae TaxID=1968276 RepID=A0A6L9LG62_9BACT|nr:hypothetical protein [Spirosoma terrae]NDU95649.1 hypothetical protein [Spirosoma terrae]